MPNYFTPDFGYLVLAFVVRMPHLTRHVSGIVLRNRDRRMGPDMAASKSQVGSRLVFEKVEQRDTAVARAESCQMAQYLDEGAHKFSGVVLA